MDNSQKIILDLCGGTGSWSKYYKDNGYDVRVITLPDYDVRTYEPPENVYGILAAPPCTMFSIARNDKTAKEPRDLKGGMEIVNACLRTIHNEYGDPYTKKTALWGEFNEPKKNIVKPREFQHNCGSRDFVSCVEHFADLKKIPEGYCEKTGLNRRTVLRSMTPLGFAKAFYEANK